ncbi:hypothetical protein [Faecalitalea cylindroides]|uniref:hypothetical protein n=1 Tax=Faecalitalea cylindroides TaxID=39483 RepID=UPI00233072ED|nr:hypothetical protein [Faecalitalea cylindroides]MDB7953151.1 hypothetical protein [Faecalitalea cylindroides]MDB7959979.1 hypothetical protein [Faecalitalea cylindroides]MDB7961601.1 hypothetical protein [Faecalitalea cylindroides]MDB7963773.1 hypothetical protein [Faecalitalea cylindroides]MDB7965586.1 hypothetical protein [Faecalitalea cylindroides]
MKKIFTFFISTFMILNLAACSSNNDDYALEFFSALDNTLELNSGHIQGTFTSNNEDASKIKFDLQLNQKDNLQLALDLDLEAGDNAEDNFLNFYIKDNKTYLNSYGTTSQSLLENLGINGSEKLSVYNPFLNYTDDELKALFTRSSKNGNNYSFTIDGSLISSYLDSMGSVTIEDATLDATIEDNYITSLTLGISGLQDVETQQVIIDVTIECTLDQINSLDTITYPADLENY